MNVSLKGQNHANFVQLLNSVSLPVAKMTQKDIFFRGESWVPFSLNFLLLPLNNTFSPDTVPLKTLRSFSWWYKTYTFIKKMHNHATLSWGG